MDNFFATEISENHYKEWCQKRVDFVLNQLGDNFFMGKTTIELGCGMAYTSRKLRDLGAVVTVADCRESTLEILRKDFDDVVLLDQDTDWVFDRKFDVVIHWGVLYHLNNWQRDLEKVISFLMHKHSVLLLESEVLDGDDVFLEIKVKESSDIWDQALSGVGTRTSADVIERKLKNLGLSHYMRYDDESLNVGDIHRYDWEASIDFKIDESSCPEAGLYQKGDFEEGLRRFWIIMGK